MGRIPLGSSFFLTPVFFWGPGRRGFLQPPRGPLRRSRAPGTSRRNPPRGPPSLGFFFPSDFSFRKSILQKNNPCKFSIYPHFFGMCFGMLGMPNVVRLLRRQYLPEFLLSVRDFCSSLFHGQISINFPHFLKSIFIFFLSFLLQFVFQYIVFFESCPSRPSH